VIGPAIFESDRTTNENNFHPKAIMSGSWCNLCEENHEESTCQVNNSSKDKIVGKKPKTTIVVLDWEEPEDVMIINTRNKSYAPKGKYNRPLTSSTLASYPQGINVQTVKIHESQGVPCWITKRGAESEIEQSNPF
jgi:hypothetical protein